MMPGAARRVLGKRRRCGGATKQNGGCRLRQPGYVLHEVLLLVVVGRLGLPELGGSYFTFSNENNYMIWVFLKKCWEKGWLYKGNDVMPWSWMTAWMASVEAALLRATREISSVALTISWLPLSCSRALSEMRCTFSATLCTVSVMARNRASSASGR